MHPEIGKADGGSPVSEMFFALMEKNIVIWRYGIRNTVCGKVQGSLGDKDQHVDRKRAALMQKAVSADQLSAYITGERTVCR